MSVIRNKKITSFGKIMTIGKILTMSHPLYRLFLSWVSVSLFVFHQTKKTFTDFSFYQDLPFGRILLAIIGVWLLSGFIRSVNVLTILTVSASAFYCMMAVTQEKTDFFAIGCAIFLFFVVWFSPLCELNLRLGRKSLITVTGVLIGVYVFWVGGVCCLSYLHHNTPNFDFGIFAQMFYYMKKTGLPLTTCERDELLSHFAVHMSPIFYLLLPVYYVFSTPLTLQIAQAALVASGVIPLVMLGRKHGLSNTACAVFAAVYTCFPAFVGGCFYYFHENNFLPPLILWMIFAFESRKKLPMVLSAVLVLMVKEDAAVYAAIVCLYFLAGDLTGKHPEAENNNSAVSASGFRILRFVRRLFTDIRLWLLAGSILYFILVVTWLSRYGDGAMTGRYSNYIYDKSGSLLVMFKAIVQNPVYLISQCFTDEKLLSSFLVFAPLGFLPFMMRDFTQLILLIPYVLFNLMSNYYYQHMLGYQYYYGSGVILFYLAILNYARLDGKKVRRAALLAALCAGAVITVSKNQWKLLGYYPGYKKHTREREAVSQVLSHIPEDAVVVCTTFFLPELSGRDEIYELYYTEHEGDYVAIDTRAGGGKNYMEQFQNDERYELYYAIDNAAAVFRKKE